MTEPVHVLHISAHLGGGVGKAISGLVQQVRSSGASVKHTIVTLEQQEKTQFIEIVKDCGCHVITCPTPERLFALVSAADVVHLEWWNHPLTIKALCSNPFPAMRLLVWSHVSGLHSPVIPKSLLLSAQQFLFTSACSFEAKEVKSLPAEVRDRIKVVSSSGGFDELPLPTHKKGERLAVGYIGSLNFSKLHPRYVDYLCAVNIPAFRVKLIGDVTNKDLLKRQCERLGKPELLNFRGYTHDIASELSSVNVLAYLLNPEHYGTTENALIEAMAMGIVPIVLDNPAERLIVEDKKTGLVVKSPEEFAKAVQWLDANPKERQDIGMQAAEFVRSRFTAKNMEASLNDYYEECLLFEKKRISFVDIFGYDPADWFLSCQENKEIFSGSGWQSGGLSEYAVYGLLEETKGTVFHFEKYFPENQKLHQWSKNIELLK